MEKSKLIRTTTYIFVFATAVILILAVIAVGMLVQKKEIERQKEELIATIDRLNQMKQGLIEEVDYQQTLEWAQKQAHALGLIGEGEEVWKLLDSDE